MTRKILSIRLFTIFLTILLPTYSCILTEDLETMEDMGKTEDEEREVSTQEEEEEEEEEELTLDELQGSWIRVGGNNPFNNGMTIEVTNDTGKIIDPVESGFEEDGVKWKGITATSKTNYDYEELGSDGNYYQSLMFFQEDDTLRLDVNSSGAGNYQKWIRLE